MGDLPKIVFSNLKGLNPPKENGYRNYPDGKSKLDKKIAIYDYQLIRPKQLSLTVLSWPHTNYERGPILNVESLRDRVLFTVINLIFNSNSKRKQFNEDARRPVFARLLVNGDITAVLLWEVHIYRRTCGGTTHHPRCTRACDLF